MSWWQKMIEHDLSGLDFLGAQPVDDELGSRLAFDLSRRCVSEGGPARPMVGVVVARDGDLLAMAYRGELKAGEHAEYTALERKLGTASIVGATVYTTLEPCTTRNHPKVPCARWLVDRKVARVVIGMVDPNPNICGKGQLMLREANIAIDLFSPALMAQVEELNRGFIREQRANAAKKTQAPHLGGNVAVRAGDGGPGGRGGDIIVKAGDGGPGGRGGDVIIKAGDGGPGRPGRR